MNRKTYKIAILLSVSILILIIRSDNSKGCGWYPEPDSYYNIFSPGLFKLPLLKPFFLSEEYFYPTPDTSSLNSKHANLQAWYKYFKNIPSIKDIDQFIYSTPKADVEKIASYLKTKNDSVLNLNYVQNSLVAYWRDYGNAGAIDYFVYAKECEPYVIARYIWGKSTKRDTTGMFGLIKLGEKKYDECKDAFLKDRYAFQVIRLAHYSYHYEEAIKLYDKYFGNRKNSLIKYWALEHKAGCLYSLGHADQSNYLFAKVFMESPSREMSCTQSFRIPNDSVFNATLALCKNAAEKATVIFIEAYNGYFIDTDAMKSIYKLDPKSKYLEALLERGIVQMERNKLPVYYENLIGEPNEYNFKTPASWSYDQFENLVDTIAQENKTARPFLWNFAAGYISTLNHQNKKAEKFFVKAKQFCPKDNQDYLNRIKIVEVINKVSGYKKIDSKAEADMLKDLKWLRNTDSLIKLKSQDAFYYIMFMLRAKYLEQGDSIKVNLCTGTSIKSNDWFNKKSAFGYNIKIKFYDEPLEAIYRYMTSKDLTPFDKFLVKNYEYTAGQIREMIATKYILYHNFKKAYKIFSGGPEFPGKLNTDTLANLPADPFTIHINDCRYCDYKADKDTAYNKKTFAERMVELENLSVKDKANAAEYYFLMANAYYNITFWGNSWSADAYVMHSSDYYEFYNIKISLPKQYYDCTPAKEYYIKAMNAAKNKELAAEACFMASKCDQNKFYHEAYNENMLYKEPKKFFEIKNKYREYFKVLKNNFSDTKFYKEAIKECKYFNSFVNNN